MTSTVRKIAPFAFMGAILLAVEIVALGLVPRFSEEGMQVTQNPQDPTNSILYIAFILVFTGFILLTLKYDIRWIIQGFVLLAAASLSFYVFTVFIPVYGAVALAGLLAVLLYFYPEWYVINSAGIVMGAGGAGIFGISFGILPALVLLSLLAVYDAIAVYRTKHMVDLAEGVMDLKLPILFVVPTKLGYSFIEEMEKARELKEAKEEASDGGEEWESEDEGNPEEDLGPEEGGEGRNAFFMGLGDAVMPTILIASSAHFMDVPIVENYATIGAILGSLVGFSILMYYVSKGEPQAGLPLLNGGTILGYIGGAVALGVPVKEIFGL